MHKILGTQQRRSAGRGAGEQPRWRVAAVVGQAWRGALQTECLWARLSFKDPDEIPSFSSIHPLPPRSNRNKSGSCNNASPQPLNCCPVPCGPDACHHVQCGQAIARWCSPMPRSTCFDSAALGRSSHVWIVGTTHCSSQMNEYASLVAHGESYSYWGTLCPLNVISKTSVTLFFKGLPMTIFGLWELGRNISYESLHLPHFLSLVAIETTQPSPRVQNSWRLSQTYP